MLNNLNINKNIYSKTHKCIELEAKQIFNCSNKNIFKIIFVMYIYDYMRQIMIIKAVYNVHTNIKFAFQKYHTTRKKLNKNIITTIIYTSLHYSSNKNTCISK